MVSRFQSVISKHNHESCNQDEIDKLKSIDIITISIQAIFNEEQNKFIQSKSNGLNLENISNIYPQFNEIQSTLYKKRLKNVPKLPTSADEVKIEGEWALTTTKEKFLRFDVSNDKDRAIIFCSNVGLEILSLAKRWHSDGTFETTTKFFYQLYIIHGWYKGVMFPCAYILLTRKDINLYKLVIRNLIELGLENKLILRPEEILTDFEQAAITAFGHYFPNASILGCFFHFGQSLYRNLCLHGMKTKYMTDDALKIWFKSLIALALIPTKDIQDEFVDLLEKAQGNKNIKNLKYFLVFEYDGMEQFCEYLTNNWFDDDCKFPINLWNHYNNRGPRTNNHIEGYNLKMKKMLGSHPNIWKFISKIKQYPS